jgi:DNA-directed RNA polymerase
MQEQTVTYPDGWVPDLAKTEGLLKQDLPEFAKAEQRRYNAEKRALRVGGAGSSDVAQVILNDGSSLAQVCAGVQAALAETKGSCGYQEALPIIRGLPIETVALAGLHACLAAAIRSHPSTVLFDHAGMALAAECWAAGLTKFDKRLAARVERKARQRQSIKARYRAAKRLARRDGYKARDWSAEDRVIVGNWLVNITVNALPKVFEWHEYTDNEGVLHRWLGLREEGHLQALEAIEATIMRHPVIMSTKVRPHPWTGFTLRSNDKRLEYTIPLVKTHSNRVRAEIKAAIADGSMRPALDALNALQGVQWRINRRVYGVLRECVRRGIRVKGLPYPGNIEIPKDAPGWRKHELRVENDANRADEGLTAEELKIAEGLMDGPFWTIMNLDFRGRVYPIPHFNFQRSDRVRALFEFARGMEIGERGLYWLKVHTANCAASKTNKIDKASLEERATWVDEHIEEIRDIAETPLTNLKWTEADSPFMYLAACLELVSALNTGSTYVTHLPVSFDGSCSGLQHLSLMTRDDITGAMVNLVDRERPGDVYSVCAEELKERIVNDDNSDKAEMRQQLLAYGIDRKLAKRNVMTFSYSSNKHGMAGQQQEDCMDDLTRQVLRHEREAHPFAGNERGSKTIPGKAAMYIAGHSYEAIKAMVDKPAQAMAFFRGCARALAHEGKVMNWKTPVGLPWFNNYYEYAIKKVRLFLHERGVRRPIRAHVSLGEGQRVRKSKCANAVSPNLVHACDAAHLMLVVNACIAEGIVNIATVHDSFGCLAPQADRFNAIIREQLVKMYQDHDVLAEVLEAAKRDLTEHNWDMLPTVPAKGNLKVDDIRNAKYAFA